MARSTQELLAFNRGRISRLGLARVDMKRLAMAADVQTNFVPRVLGCMSLRPGLGYIKTLSGASCLIPFVFASDDTAIVEIHNGTTTFTISDAALTRSAVTAAIANGTFGTDLASWSDQDDAGGTSAWEAGGYMGLTGNGTAIARRRQQVTVNQQSVEHGLRVTVARGPVTIRVGSSAGGTEYINDWELQAGSHSIAFTPTTSSFYVDLFNQANRLALVDSIAVESSGAVALTSPWVAADLELVRYDQSGDIIFCACEGYRQRKIMRRAARSWSIEEYLTENGPFRIENVSTTTITPSALTGNITLTSSAIGSVGIFKSTHVGALFKITSAGQTVTDSFTSANDFSTYIKVSGVGESRRFAISVTGTFVATATLQRSADEGTSWQDVATYDVEGATTLADGLDNQLVWYRIGIKTSQYTSGTVDCSLIYSSGSITGVVRVTAYTNTTTVSAEVLSPLGGTAATEVWAEGSWSDYRGWPSAVRFHDGRLFWAGKDKFWGSVTDQFYSFDSEFEGDAGPINRSIGYGPVDSINWLLSLNRLIAGTDGSEVSCRSSSLNEPLTPTNFTPKDSSTQGSARVQAVKVDAAGLFVQRSGRSVYQIAYDINGEDYRPDDLTKLVPEIGDPGIVAMAVQRKPDTRLHCVRSDGTVAMLVIDTVENVIAWVDIETDGEVQCACVLPGDEEDLVYYVVKRVIGGSDAYYLEKWALESEARGGAVNKMADSFVYAAGSGSTITGLSHLEGETVVAWGGGDYIGSFTVAGGTITLGASYTHRCAGLAYTGQFQSTKLAYAFPDRSALLLRKKIGHLGLLLTDTHRQGLEFGPSFTTMDPLPATERYETVTADWDEYDAQPIEFPGEWSTDARLCLQAEAPKPCTVLAAVIELETNR